MTTLLFSHLPITSSLYTVFSWFGLNVFLTLRKKGKTGKIGESSFTSVAWWRPPLVLWRFQSLLPCHFKKSFLSHTCSKTKLIKNFWAPLWRYRFWEPWEPQRRNKNRRKTSKGWMEISLNILGWSLKRCLKGVQTSWDRCLNNMLGIKTENTWSQQNCSNYSMFLVFSTHKQFTLKSRLVH